MAIAKGRKEEIEMSTITEVLTPTPINYSGPPVIKVRKISFSLPFSILTILTNGDKVSILYVVLHEIGKIVPAIVETWIDFPCLLAAGNLCVQILISLNMDHCIYKRNHNLKICLISNLLL